jgi:hypothetical protein
MRSGSIALGDGLFGGSIGWPPCVCFLKNRLLAEAGQSALRYSGLELWTLPAERSGRRLSGEQFAAARAGSQVLRIRPIEKR